MAQPLWNPSSQRVDQSRLKAFENFIFDNYHLHFADYKALHQWSVNHPSEFWKAVWDFFEVKAAVPPTSILDQANLFPGAKWFTGARFNYAENLLKRKDDGIALIGRLETGARREVTHAELYNAVTALASTLRKLGVSVGDRVAGFMPNVPETVIAMLATTSIGAIWSSCSPDFGISGVMDRFGQIQPKVMFACDGYFYNGKVIDCSDRVRDISQNLDGLEKLVIVPVVGDLKPADLGIVWQDMLDKDPLPLQFEQLPFDHPLYILYSSGTTGVPKCIVHCAGGTLLKHYVEQQLHADIQPGDVLYYFTTCGWMMWNWLVSGLTADAVLILYDGSPFYPDAKAMFDMA